MMYRPSDDELMHYGILGMHWGVRRYQPYSVRGRKSGKTGKEIGQLKKRRRTREEVIKDNRANDAKNVRRLSDKDLNAKIDRLQKEQRLRELTERDLHPARAEVKKILSSSGRKVAGAVVSGATLYGIKYAVENGKIPNTIKDPKLRAILKKINKNELAKYLVKGGPGKK